AAFRAVGGDGVPPARGPLARPRARARFGAARRRGRALLRSRPRPCPPARACPRLEHRAPVAAGRPGPVRARPARAVRPDPAPARSADVSLIRRLLGAVRADAGVGRAARALFRVDAPAADTQAGPLA